MTPDLESPIRPSCTTINSSSVLVGGAQSNGEGATEVDGGAPREGGEEIVSTEEEVLAGKQMRTPPLPNAIGSR